MKYLCLIFAVILSSCQPKLNQYQKISKTLQVKTGKWIVEDNYPNEKYKSIGRYKMNEKIGTWKTYLNGKIYQKDCHRDSIIYTKRFYPNGVLAARGQSKTIVKKGYFLWFYSGKWRYYNKKGKLDYIKLFYKDKGYDSINCKADKAKCLNIK